MGMGGGGGGSSGKVDFPEYMKTWHTAFLGAASAGISLTEAMNSATTGVSPYASFVGVDVGDSFLGSGKVITNYGAPFTYLSTYCVTDFATNFNAFKTSNNNGINTYMTDFNNKVTQAVSAESNILESDLNQVVLPKFKAGMRSVNAVMSSAFVIGEAVIRAGKTRDLAKTDAVLRLEGFKQLADMVQKNDILAMDYATKVILGKRDIATTAMDFAKLYVTAKSEIDDANIEMDAKDRLWDLKVFQYGGNFLGSIAGSAVSTDKGDRNSKVMSTIGGAIGGAAMGAQIGTMAGGPGWGTAIGAVAGAAYGLFSG